MKTREELLAELNKENELLFHHYFIPIIGAKTENKIENLYGTCSYLGNNIFITAGHCLENISEFETKLVLFYNYKVWKGEEILDIEIYKEYDIAIFKVNSVPNEIQRINWAKKEPLIFDSVFACGFPHGFDVNRQRINSRGLKGHVAGLTEKDIFIKGKPFKAIETSFACPKGISGAPLVEWNKNVIHGIVLGNTLVSIITHENREFSDDGKEKSYFATEETTRLGMVISNQTLFQLDSKFLGGKLIDYLERERLLQ